MTFSQQIKEYVTKLPNSDYYLNNTNLLPSPELRFRALDLVESPDNVKVIILGQDPYPNAASACGISFLDAQIKSFLDPQMAPSLRNLLKSLLKYKNLSFNNMEEFRSLIKQKFTFKDPMSWFTALSQQGVLFLNAALTFESTETLSKHQKFWKQPVLEIFKQIMQHSNPVFVLMGSQAQKFEIEILKLKGQFRIVKTKHPVVNDFISEGLFQQIEAAQKELGKEYIDFFEAQAKSNE
ncbi:Uracil-DNA_glycosylase [Hexamita inflata]|uniref:Uracil-DNA glycosylase n=1 Tax=Hexamita inflata TaxID=28002 RepID=A0AA86NZQ2_9EUKA|nr:Uracil-DNA glycosylase [Hexamita inflata]